MQAEVKGIYIKKLDAYRENVIPNKEKLAVKININISLIELKETESDDFVIKSSFTLSILEHNTKTDIGNINAQLDVLIGVDSKEELISEWENTGDKKLPQPIRTQIDNSIFYFTMPVAINLAEKMQMPIPIPPLINKK
ncbi:hypothetical protein HWN40_13200 [Methanolobus zinderi]|uniref:Preprotein translocase subunit SecB n=1 Tax=Methanolobus zinderi TaxID=536044 RepID=A0A7D5I274_9EURY|nr:hypothetical protein [Methanolobus zinderi]QLC51106.1 hypothetical protein HWN40_13200 [Methanolobus zinderi]